MGYIATLYRDANVRGRVTAAGTSATALIRVVGACMKEDVVGVAKVIGPQVLERAWQVGSRVAGGLVERAIDEIGTRMFGAKR